MTWHKNERIHQALVGLMDALVSWERSTGRGGKLFYFPAHEDEATMFLMDGKPVDHSPFLLIIQLEGLIEDLKGKEDLDQPFEVDARVFAMPLPWYAREPWVSIWLALMALFAGITIADMVAQLWRWLS